MTMTLSPPRPHRAGRAQSTGPGDAFDRVGVYQSQLGGDLAPGLHPRRRLLGVYPRALWPVHVRAVPPGSTLAYQRHSGSVPNLAAADVLAPHAAPRPLYPLLGDRVSRVHLDHAVRRFLRPQPRGNPPLGWPDPDLDHRRRRHRRRGVPLITVLFMSSVMLLLFLSEDTQIDKLLRALVGVIMFQSAYVAEVVRGVLQALPKGQTEAAESLALGYWKTQGLIILPQALKMVIPGLVNTIIALFKDTSLVVIIGLFDLFSSVQQATVDPS